MRANWNYIFGSKNLRNMYELKYVVQFEDGTYCAACEWDLTGWYYSDVKYTIL